MKVDVKKIRGVNTESRLLLAALRKIMILEKRTDIQAIVDNLCDEYSDIEARFQMDYFINELKRK